MSSRCRRTAAGEPVAGYRQEPGVNPDSRTETFVALRLAHAFVHTTSNYVPTRFNIFAAGFMVLLAMWADFAYRVITQL